MSEDHSLAAASVQALARTRKLERFRFTTTRPVAVLMVFLAAVVFGGFSMRLLPLELMPDISYPKLTVRTEYPGAAPAEVENAVARPLEEILGVVGGLTRISSISRAGHADLVLEFMWDTDMDEANQDVLEKLDAIKAALPKEVEQPIILRYDPSLDAVMTLSLSGGDDQGSNIERLKWLRRLADREVRRLIEPVSGVAAVKLQGGLEEEIEVELDEGALRRTNIDIQTVISRLQAENVNLAGGSMRDGRTRYLVRTVNEFMTLDDVRNTVIVSKDGRDIRVRDVGEVRSGYKDREVLTRLNGLEAVEIEVHREADANIVDMAAAVRERIREKLRPRLESEYGAQLDIVADRSQFIRASINEVRSTAMWGGVLAVGVLFLFLRSVKATAIVAVAIPISILVTFACFHVSDITLNVMSLGGLALGVGMLVDNSIVVIESIYRCMEEGDRPIQATLRGTAEVGGAVVSSTLTSVAVFFPMVFVEGVAGQMFGDLGLTVVFSLLASLAVALFFVPMLSSRVVGEREANDDRRGQIEMLRSLWRTRALAMFMEAWRGNRWVATLLLPYSLVRMVLQIAFELVGKLFASVALVLGGLVVAVTRGIARALAFALSIPLGLFDRAVRALERAYERAIRWSLRNRVVVYASVLGSFAFLAWGVPRLDSELIPELHQGELTVELALPVGTPLERTDEVIMPVERRVLDTVPNLVSLSTKLGTEVDSNEDGERGEHTARLTLSLSDATAIQEVRDSESETPHEDFDETSRKLRDPARTEQQALTVVRDIIDDIPDVRTTITRPTLFSFKTPIEVEVRGHDLVDLADATEQVELRVQELSGLTDVSSSIRPGSPEIQIVYDRDAIARLGLDVRKVAELVRNKVQGFQATKYNRKDRKIPIRVRVQNILHATIDDLRQLVVNPGGAHPVPLEAIADVTLGRGPNEIRRVGQQRVGVVTANVAGIALGSASAHIGQEIAQLQLPANVSTAITGQSQEWDTSSRSLYLAFGLSVFLVYVVMAAEFESLVYPLIILFTIPLALLGVVAVLLALQLPISVVVLLGVITLTGIVVNNAIVLVDYAGQLKQRGHTANEALVAAGRVRLRPILMTTLTTVLGLVPMALGLGEGTEIRTPMAITIIAGLSASTLLTLVVIPTLYAAVDDWLVREGHVDPELELEYELAHVDTRLLAPEVSDLQGASHSSDDAERT